MTQINRYALTGGTILCSKSMRVSKADVLIEDGRIKGIGNFKAEPVKHDISGCLLSPGFINTHAHLGETIFRDFISFSCLKEYIEQTEAINRLLGHRQESVRAASVDMTLLELMKNGTTTVCAGRCAEACDGTGIRSFSGYVFMKSNKLSRFINSFTKYFEDYLRSMEMTSLSNPLIFLHSLKFCDQRVLELCGRLVTQYHIPFTVHVSETENEERECHRRFGGSSITTLDKYGLLYPKSLLVHCCYISDDDILLIKKNGATVVLCPTSNLHLGNRLPPVEKLLDAGVNLAIATDGLVTNPSPSLIDECLVVTHLWPEVTASNILGFITINPARALGIDAGVLKVGALADMVVFRLPQSAGIGVSSEKNTLQIIHSAKIQDVIVEGQFIMKNGLFVTINEREVTKNFEDARELVRKCIRPT